MCATDVHSDLFAAVQRQVARRESLVSFQEVKDRSRAAASARDAYAAVDSDGCAIIAQVQYNQHGVRTTQQRIHRAALAAVEIEMQGAQLLACSGALFGREVANIEMDAARAAVHIPVVSLDTIVDPYQVHEARCYGADALVLRADILEQPRLEALLDRAETLGMSAFVQVGDAEEAARALRAGASVLAVVPPKRPSGETDHFALGELVAGLPSKIRVVMMADVLTPRDLFNVAAAGADAILANAEAAIPSLATAGRHPACASRR